MKREHTKTNENTIFSALFFFSCSENKPNRALAPARYKGANPILHGLFKVRYIHGRGLKTTPLPPD